MTVKEKIMKDIAEEMERAGFINSSDNADRLEDKLAGKYQEEYQDETGVGIAVYDLGADIREWMKLTYKEVGDMDDDANMTSYFYPISENYESLKDFEVAKGLLL